MFRWSLVVARVWGIPIRIHFTLLILLAWLLVDALREDGVPGIVFMGVLSFLFVLGIALHELGHSLVGLWKGCRIREITLTPLGGVAQMENVPHRPRDEFLMAVAGPAVSVMYGAIFWVGGAYLPLPQGLVKVPFLGLSIRTNLVQSFGLLNFGLAIFNLAPAFPMDGGRVFRALLTPKLGRLRATHLAARVGQFLALLFGIWVVYEKPFNWPFLVAIAFFIYIAAGTEYRMVQLQEAFRRSGLASVFWPSSDEPAPPPDSGDQAVVSPPPYEDGPASKTDVRSSDDDFPFGPPGRS